MKKLIVPLVITLFFALTLVSCSQEKIVDTVTTEWSTYNKMSDGTWKLNNISYRYRLEISGRMPNAAKESTFVYLSNLENITFEQAWKAAGLSSNLADYFSVEEAVLVEWK